MTTPEHSPLGKNTIYADHYDPSLLFAIPRADKRAEIGVAEPLPFHGVDIWNAYELSWLDLRGKPVVALAEFRVPATSPNIIESKSFKLYLNGFAQERIADADALIITLTHDLSAAAGATVSVQLRAANAAALPAIDLDGHLLDAQDIAIDHYGPPQAEFLHADARANPVEETVVSHLLRSNCPVTGQPDWGSVQIAYRGTPIDHAGLLRYLVSFRDHNEFHEQCVERIFVDLMQRCAPQQLSVYARYTRRGGLDINPFRSSTPATPGNPRTVRQ
ncbi:NADPH-dependent 7-cyano-7-deazaguanine reductase QueF [Rhodanobacter sp. C03]|uniref:NADPH-dependent 7-cyano-7-deazaguanine reductase QueF n=1 Tax=Rhodanobacter sp. C03 TaxID=1945858 RepID=UPI000985BE98|nr:NADPH-dependent 7-cyano-7-deazaguanine reductase QueF [Rhodanobacter sp. C03]OOG59398.1 NADPH-dependent 7-cyano-7-deazaguanine reductase QueF [Rhodanobacter sp. C03]